MSYTPLLFHVLQVIIGTIYVFSVYWLSDQPLELVRICQFLVVCLLIGFVSESLGLTISSRLDIVVSTFENQDFKQNLMTNNYTVMSYYMTLRYNC
jgi:hypothetical protein